MLTLSPLTKNLIIAYKEIEKEQRKDISAKIEVSQAVSFFGSLYEKMRNALEYRESHLVRKATIARILKRRLLLNQRAQHFSDSLVKELLWGKYLPGNTISESKAEKVKKIAEKYLTLRQNALAQLQDSKQLSEVSDWIIELLACRIEFILAPNKKNEVFTNFVFEWMRPNITIKNQDQKTKDILVYLATHEALNKTDEPLLRYFFIDLYGEKKLFTNFWDTYKITNKYVSNKFREKIVKYIRSQTAPFLILDSLLDEKLLSDQEKLKEKVIQICNDRYKQVNNRLRRAAVRSIIYLFLTKMVLAFLLEIPADRYFGGKIDVIPLAINISFPPFLMFFIALLISTPDNKNTERIYNRIIQILTQTGEGAEKRVFVEKSRVGKPLLTFIFTIIYTLTFLLVFGLIVWGLTAIGFNFFNQIIFLFFLTVVTFFAYRIRQIPLEYRYRKKEGILSPVIDFLMLPILSVGKKLSVEIGKINIITFIFDFILEAPFKAIFDVFEEWIGFLRTKREEII